MTIAAQLELARRLTSEGRTDEATETLRRAAGTGDAGRSEHSENIF